MATTEDELTRNWVNQQDRELRMFALDKAIATEENRVGDATRTLETAVKYYDWLHAGAVADGNEEEKK